MPFRPEVVRFDAEEKELLATVGRSKRDVVNAVSKALGTTSTIFRELAGTDFIDREGLSEGLSLAEQYQRTLESLPATEEIREIRARVDEAIALLRDARGMVDHD